MKGWIAQLALAAACAMVVSCAGSSGWTNQVDPEMPPEKTGGPGTLPPGTGKRTKLWTGTVRFVGFSEEQLDDIRVIPEESSRVYRPRNTEYRGVDGFWWKPDPVNWFKIPGHCEVVVWPLSYRGETPQVRASDEELLVGSDRPRTWLRCKPWLTQILMSQGRIYKAGWYPNSGKSSIGAKYPF